MFWSTSAMKKGHSSICERGQYEISNAQSANSRWDRGRIYVFSLVLFAVLAGIFTHFFIRQGFLDNMDERNYLWLADRILEKHVTAEAIPQDISQHFAVWWRGEHNSRQYTVFPVGWPLLLALGQAFSAPWIINPLLAGLVVYLVFLIANTMYDSRLIATRAALLLTFCPLFIFQAASMLSHISTLFWIMLGIFAIVYSLKSNREIFVLVGGISFGLGFATRPLDALAISTPVIIWLSLHNRSIKTKLVRQALLIVLGIALGSIPFWLYNKAVTGSVLLTPQQLYGFPEHLLASSFSQWCTGTLIRTIRQIRDWQEWFLPAGLVLLFSFILVARGFNSNDLFWIGTIAALLTAYSFNVAYFDICGPRYHLFVAVPTCILISRVLAKWNQREVFLTLAAIMLYYLAVFGYQGSSMWKDIKENRALDLCVRAKHLTKAIVFVPDGYYNRIPSRDLLSYSPDSRGIVYALDIPETNHKVLEHFPHVPAYKWDPNNRILISKTPEFLKK
jgi:hypothetical protein